MGTRKPQKIKQQLLDRGIRDVFNDIRKDRRILSIILAVAIFVRVLAALTIEYTPNPGTAKEIALLERIVLDGEWSVTYPPLYALFLRIVYAVAGPSNHLLVFVVQALVSSIVIVCMYIVGRMLCNRTTGLIVAALSAVYPNFIVFNLMAYPDSFGIVIVALIMAAAAVDVPDTYRTYLSAVLVGVGIHIQPLLAYLLPGMLLTARKKMLFVCIVAAILAPWIIRNSVVQGKFTPVYGGNAFEIDLEKKYTGKNKLWNTIHSYYYNTSTVLRKGWHGSLSRGDNKLRNLNYICAYSYLAVMMLGILGVARYIQRKHIVIVIPIVGYIALLIALSNAQIRFRIHIVPLLLFFTAILVERCFQGFRIMRARRAAIPR